MFFVFVGLASISLMIEVVSSEGSEINYVIDRSVSFIPIYKFHFKTTVPAKYLLLLCSTRARSKKKQLNTSSS